MGMLPTEIPISIEDRLGHISPMMRFGLNARGGVGPFEERIAFPRASDDFEIMWRKGRICEYSETASNKFL